jgi:hypothetical protein
MSCSWILGALNSAFRAVWEVVRYYSSLLFESNTNATPCIYRPLHHEGRADLKDLMKARWGFPDEFDPDHLGAQVALGQHHPFQTQS